MTQEYEIRTLKDIADLSPDQQEHFLIDLKRWLEYRNTFRELEQSMGAQLMCDDVLTWKDDGDYGRVSEVRVRPSGTA